MKSQPTGAFYVLSALGPVGTHVEILAAPFGSLSAARGARERLVRQGQNPSACVVHAYPLRRSRAFSNSVPSSPTPTRSTSRGCVLHRRRWRCGSLGLKTSVNLFAVHGYVSGRRESKSHLIGFYAKYGDGHLITDHQRLSCTSAQNEHRVSPL